MNNSYLNNLDYEPLRKASNRKKIRWIAVIVLFIVMIFTVILATKNVTAKRDGYRVKQVISIEIKKGDTLWGIASRHMSDEYNDMNDYIAEIMVSNGLSSDNIQAGNHIIVPYYADNTQ
jgi:cell division protein YceG involved in septum cleavage